MTLEELIIELEKRPSDVIVQHGFGSGHSDRGDYCNLAFDPMSSASFGEMLEHAKNALGKTFTGYKGGEYEMSDYTDCLIGNWGECGEHITKFNFLYWDTFL